eukprot:13557062-Alexandrium_andersonii.AAC.1
MKSTFQWQITEYMSKRNIQRMVLQETRTPQTTQYIIGKHQFLLFGSGEAKEYAGVGFVVDLRLRSSVTFTYNVGARIA